MELVQDVSNWKKWWSMRFTIATAFFAAVSAAYLTLPEDWLPAIPDLVKQLLAYGTLLTAAAAGVSRVVRQKSLKEE